jgi:hypothetical protein
MIRANPLEQLHPAHARHFLVGKDDVDRFGAKDFFGFFGTICQSDVELILQKCSQRGKDVRLVIHNQNSAPLTGTHTGASRAEAKPKRL